MSVYSLTLRVQKTPPVMLRKRHVLILLRDQNNRYVLGQKKIYPKGISRMIGGGVETYEPFFRAASRELYEELKYFAPRQSLKEVGQVLARITDEAGQKFEFTTGLYFTQIERRPLFPSDDLDGIIRLSDPEYLALVQRYKNLPKEIDPQLGFAWYDYGQLYAPIHEIAWDFARQIDIHGDKGI